MRALSHSGRPCAPGTPLACCRKGRYSVGVPSGGGGTGLSSQRWRTSKVFVPSSNTFKLICLRATALLSLSHSAPMVSHGGVPVPCHLSQSELLKDWPSATRSVSTQQSALSLLFRPTADCSPCINVQPLCTALSERGEKERGRRERPMLTAEG